MREDYCKKTTSIDEHKESLSFYKGRLSTVFITSDALFNISAEYTYNYTNNTIICKDTLDNCTKNCYDKIDNLIVIFAINADNTETLILNSCIERKNVMNSNLDVKIENYISSSFLEICIDNLSQIEKLISMLNELIFSKQSISIQSDLNSISIIKTGKKNTAVYKSENTYTIATDISNIINMIFLLYAFVESDSEKGHQYLYDDHDNIILKISFKEK